MSYCTEQFSKRLNTAAPRLCAVQYSRRDRTFWNPARLSWRVLITLNLYEIYSRAPIQTGRESFNWERVRVRGWTHLRGGSGSVVLPRSIGHARYWIPKLEERSASAPQVHMRRMYNVRTVHAGQKEQRAKTVPSMDIATPMNSLKALTLNEGSTVQMIHRHYNYTDKLRNPQVGHRQGFTAIYADGGIYPPRPGRMHSSGSYVALGGTNCNG
eukprot:6188595-Pleurochrysis_carterae.AAC.2